jgi:hypothetical protein
MLLLCNLSMLSAQEASSPIAIHKTTNPEYFSGPSAASAAPAAKRLSLQQRKMYYRLGERLITINKQVTDDALPYMFVSLHNNESNVADAARRFVFTQGGSLLEVLNDNQRNIDFTLFEKEVSVDPNNIFTPRGRNQDLSANKKTDMIIAHQLDGFAQFILGELPHDKVIVSVHSNANGDYTINDYGKNGDKERDAWMMHRNPALDENNFFVTTSRDLFNLLKERNVNVVLQSIRSKDDGSLGVFCGRTHRDYIGIETRMGDDQEQAKMVQLVHEILK